MSSKRFKSLTGKNEILNISAQKGSIVSKYEGKESWLMDAGKGTFDSGMESWAALGTNTIENDAGALKITYGNDEGGAVVYLRNTADLNTDLVIGKTYKLRLRAKRDTDVYVRARIRNIGYSDVYTIGLTIDYVWYDLIFVAGSTIAVRFQLGNLGSGSVWIDQWYIERWFPDGRGIIYNEKVITYDTVLIAGDYGFNPSASAEENAIAWNSIPGEGFMIKITQPGVYEIDTTLWLKSNTTYDFCSGVTIKKATGSDFSYIFANDAYLNNKRNENIIITADSLRLQINDIESRAGPLPRIFGQISLYQLDNFEVNGIYCNDHGTDQFFFTMSDVTNGTIKNMSIIGTKDGIDLIGSVSDITMDSIYIQTSDDGLFIGCAGYPGNTPTIGDIDNITISNLSDSASNSTNAMTIRVDAFSWTGWDSLNVYQSGDIVVSDSKIYHKMDNGQDTGRYAPTHISGIDTLADGIQWRYVKNGIDTTANVTNLTFKDSKLSGKRSTIHFENPNDTAYWRGAYPGTYGNATIDNIELNNITWEGSEPNAIRFYSDTKIGNLTMKNCINTQPAQAPYFCAFMLADNDCYLERFFIDSCDFTFADGAEILNITGASGGNLFYADTIKIDHSSFTGGDGSGTNGLIRASDINTWNTVLIDNSIFTDVERLIHHITEPQNSIVANNCSFLSMKYLLANTGANANIEFVADLCTFTEPGGVLFFNNAATATMNITTTNSTSNVSAEKIQGGGYVTLVSCDL